MVIQTYQNFKAVKKNQIRNEIDFSFQEVLFGFAILRFERIFCVGTENDNNSQMKI